MTRSRARLYSSRLALVMSGLFLGVLFGELGLRVLGLPRSGPFLQEFRGEGFKVMSYDENPSGALDLDFRDPAVRERVSSRLYDPADFERSWRDTPYGVTFDFNAQGFRERAFQPRAVARGQRGAARRIVIVGDSFTVGHGLPNGLAYPRRLEARLREPKLANASREASSGDRDDRIEVYNLGQGDTDLKQILRVAGFGLNQLDPDMLVYGYFLNDPLRTLERDSDVLMHDMLDAGWIDMEQSRTTTRIGQSEHGVSRVIDLILAFRADRSVTNSTVDWYQRLHQPEAWRPTRDQIVRLSRAAARREVEFLVVLLPLPFEISGDSPFSAAHRHMAEALGAAGVEVLDALPALRGFADRDLRLHPRDRHPSPLYTERVSELLAERIASIIERSAP